MIKGDDNLSNSIKKLIEYSNQSGFPTVREWDKYANINGMMNTAMLLHGTGKRWFELRKELGFENSTKSKRKQELESKRILAIQHLQIAAKNMGMDFSKRQYEAFANEKGYITVGQLTRLFRGKFNNAKLAANLTISIADDKFSDKEIVETLRACAAYYNNKRFSEQEYGTWRGNQDIARPHIETIRKRLGNLPELKNMIELKTYILFECENEDLTEQYCLSAVKKFINEMLNSEKYAKWAKENNMPSLVTILKKTGKNWDELKK